MRSLRVRVMNTSSRLADEGLRPATGKRCDAAPQCLHHASVACFVAGVVGAVAEKGWMPTPRRRDCQERLQIGHRDLVMGDSGCTIPCTLELSRPYRWQRSDPGPSGEAPDNRVGQPRDVGSPCPALGARTGGCRGVSTVRSISPTRPALSLSAPRCDGEEERCRSSEATVA